MTRFIAGMVTGAVLLYTAMHYHVVRGDRGYYLVPKLKQDFSDIYVDTRGFELDDWRRHKPLAAAIMGSDKEGLIRDSAMRSFGSRLSGMVREVFE